MDYFIFVYHQKSAQGNLYTLGQAVVTAKNKSAATKHLKEVLSTKEGYPTEFATGQDDGGWREYTAMSFIPDERHTGPRVHYLHCFKPGAFQATMDLIEQIEVLMPKVETALLSVHSPIPEVNPVLAEVQELNKRLKT